MGQTRDLFWEAVFAAYLHDIGKFVQRSVSEARYESHPELTELFLGHRDGGPAPESPLPRLFRAAGLDEDAIVTAATYHHEDTRMSRHVQQIAASPHYALAQLVNRADSLSSGERAEVLAEGPRSQRLHDILAFVRLADTGDPDAPAPAFLHVAMSELDDLPLSSILVSEDDARGRSSASLYERFLGSLDAIAATTDLDPWGLALTLESVLRNYLWCIPSDTRLARRDISLFDHARTTAAIAGAAYRYLEESDGELDARRVLDLLGSASQTPCFLFIAGDFTGIQRYIFKSHGGSGYAKRLRARSFLVRATVTAAALSLLRKLGLSPANLIYDTGGKFYILAHNTETARQRLAAFERALAEFCAAREFGTRSMVFAHATATAEDLYGQRDRFAGLLANVEHELEAAKKGPDRALLLEGDRWNTDRFVFSTYETPADLCPQCGMRRASTRTELESFNASTGASYDEETFSSSSIPCSRCLLERRFGELLPQPDIAFARLTEGSETPPAAFELAPGVFLDLLSAREARETGDAGTRLALLNVVPLSAVFENGESLPPHLVARPTNFHVPRLTSEEANALLERATELPDDELPRAGQPKSFTDMARLGEGDDRLAVLKADVDVLGFVVQRGVSDLSMSRYATFATMLELFFTSRIRYLLTKGRDGGGYRNVYLVFGGGDDLFLAGHWWEIATLAADVLDEFSRWCATPDITLSAAIEIVDPRTPFHLLAERLESDLSRVKSAKKPGARVNAASVFDHSIAAEELRSVIELARETADALSDASARANLQRLIDVYHEARTFHEDNALPVPTYLAHLAYLLARHGDTGTGGLPPALADEVRHALSLAGFPRLRRAAIAARLAHLLTRERAAS